MESQRVGEDALEKHYMNRYCFKDGSGRKRFFHKFAWHRYGNRPSTSRIMRIQQQCIYHLVGIDQAFHLVYRLGRYDKSNSSKVGRQVVGAAPKCL